MSNTPKSDSQHVPVTEAAEVRHILGDVDDDVVAEILRLQPTLSELEIAATFLRGEGNEVDRLGHPLSGKAAQIFEILSSIEEPEEQRR